MEHNKDKDLTKDTARIDAFSDGVFAIAITLLVLELITILHPQNSDKGLLNTISEHWQSFFAFAMGFLTILVCWINHHAAFEYIKKADTNLMWINGFLLFLITLTPFPTAIVAEYLGKESRTALAVFGFHYILISVAADLICSYVYSHHLVAEDHREYYYTYKKLYRYAIFYNLIAFALCFVSVIIPVILYAILFSFFAAPKKFSTRFHRVRMAKKK